MPSLLQVWALPASFLAIVNITATWYNFVSKEVPEPYLDEFFHVPQAQKYCQGDYSWDPKITTPPGLYLMTKFLKPIFGCDTSSLRLLNAVALCLICPLCYSILRLLQARGGSDIKEHTRPTETQDKQTQGDSTVILDAHSALNIALFPPLFFFSALYYTDVISTLLVLLAYSAFLKRRSRFGSITDTFTAVAIGIGALFFRQTNIFWAAIFPAGLAVVDILKRDTQSSAKIKSYDAKSILQSSWTEGLIYDCDVADAGPEDYVIFLLSIAIAAIRRPIDVLRAITPYGTLLVLFAGFVVWNGSVVLGDKSAHTATVHIPQMLYMWPYIAFFSLPLLVGPVLQPFLSLMPQNLQELCNNHLSTSTNPIKPSILVPSVFIVGSMGAAHYNTIIHPYTLADNRHYVFYVFRIFRRFPLLKYLAAPVYCFCAWLTLNSLAYPSTGSRGTGLTRQNRPIKNKTNREPCQISFIVVWLGTTALSVVTAPLVEPRYFIAPWVIWRLHVAYSPASLPKNKPIGSTSYDFRLILETIWLLAVNAAVSYAFLYRTFAWSHEPENKQRFIW